MDVDTKEQLGRLVDVAGVRLAVLFGSVARGDARPDSDADLGILGGTFWEQLELGSRLAAHLRREPHVVDLAEAGELLRFEIARDGIPIFEVDHAWPRFQAEAMIAYWDFAPILKLQTEAARKRLGAEASGG